MHVNKGERAHNGMLPEGPYLVEVKRVSAPKESKAGNRMRTLTLALLGTDLIMPYYIAEHPNSWKFWQEFLPSFAEAESLIGRRFITMVKKRPVEAGFKRELAGANEMLCEVLTDEGQPFGYQWDTVHEKNLPGNTDGEDIPF